MKRSSEFENSRLREPDRDPITIRYDNCTNGLGIKIIGGALEGFEEFCGVFVKRILNGGLAQEDGTLQEGDQILFVNGQPMKQITNTRAVAMLRSASASNHVELIVSRDIIARTTLVELMENQIQSDGSSHASLDVSSPTSSARSQHDISTREFINAEVDYVDSSQEASSPTFQDSEDSHNNRGNEDVLGTAPMLEGASNRARLRKVPNMAAYPDAYQRQNLIPQGLLLSSTPQSQKNPAPSERVLLRTHQGLDPSPIPNISQTSLPSLTEHLSVDTHARLSVDKLELAMKYLGLETTPTERSKLRQHLPLDSDGTVNFGDFVRVARQLFQYQLQDIDICYDPPVRESARSTTQLSTRKVQANKDSKLDDELKNTKKERDLLKREINKLKQLLKQKETACTAAEEEAVLLRKTAQEAIHESHSLRSKVLLESAAHTAARDMENDYEEVIQILEAEINQLKSSQAQQLESPAMQKRLAVLTCQLRKSELGRKTYEVTTDKLLQFAELVYRTLSSGNDVAIRGRHGGSAHGDNPPPFLGHHKSGDSYSLAAEAKDVVRAVRTVLEAEPLPFGWEEAYTEEGVKYYTNHVTQTTSWKHPLSNIEQTSMDVLPESHA